MQLFQVRRKRFVPNLNVGNLFAVQVLGTAIRPTNFVLLRLNVKIKEEGDRRRRRKIQRGRKRFKNTVQ